VNLRFLSPLNRDEPKFARRIILQLALFEFAFAFFLRPPHPFTSLLGWGPQIWQAMFVLAGLILVGVAFRPASRVLQIVSFVAVTMPYALRAVVLIIAAREYFVALQWLLVVRLLTWGWPMLMDLADRDR
jgi:hypothetical protein